jgi:glycosyltransferase involved in cell wall biosynthesis
MNWNRGESRALIIIPAYREASRIGQVVRGIRQHVPNVDILVIDDGSGDGTAARATEAGATVVSHTYNMGYGAAVQTGFKYAQRHNYDYVVQMDGDGQHEPLCVSDLLAAVKRPDVDIAMGSRWLGLAEYNGPLLRKFGKFFFGFLASRLTRHEVTDPTTGFQALSKEVVAFFCTDVYPVDYPDANVIIMLTRAGFQIREVPVIMYRDDSGQSMHGGLIRPIYYGMKMMMSIVMTLLRNDRKIREGILGHA